MPAETPAVETAGSTTTAPVETPTPGITTPAPRTADRTPEIPSTKLTSVPVLNCPPPVSYQLVPDRKLAVLTEKLSESIHEAKVSIEEWGTLTLSGLLLAPPRKPAGGTDPKALVGTFGVDINGSGAYNFKKWFEEAGKSEGSVQFSERIFNSLVASGTLQLAPEQAALAQSFFERQKAEQQIFQDQLQRNRIQRAAELDDFSATRADRSAAQQLRIEATRDAARLSGTAQAEAEIISTETDQRLAVAEKELVDAKAVLAADPNNADKQQIVAEKEANVSRARTESAAAAVRLSDARSRHKTDHEAYVTALNTPLSAADALGGSGVPEQQASPLFPIPTDKAFSFAQKITPGTSTTKLKASDGSSNLPTVASTDISTLGDTTTPLVTPDPNSAFPARARLIDAAGNQTISRIFDFLGNPAAALAFKDKPILMATGTIAVNPGWRTTEEYDGQIDVSVKYQWKRARWETCDRITKTDGLFNPQERRAAQTYCDNRRWPTSEGYTDFTDTVACLNQKTNAPLAVAVSPLMERQNIDEGSSRARQDEIALFLSASLAKSGQKAAGDVFDKYIKMRRLDVKTRSSLPVVNGYGLGSSRFGFNVTSRIQAVGSVNKPKATKVLEKQNFPVLVMLGLTSDDLRPRLVKNKVGKVETAEIWEPQLVLVQTQRWGRQQKRGEFHQVLRSIFAPGFPSRPAQSPADGYERIEKVNRAWASLTSYLDEHQKAGLSRSVASFKKLAEDDISYLSQASYGVKTSLDIPVEYLVGLPPEVPEETETPAGAGEPTIVSVFPNNLTMTPVKGKVEGQAAEVVVGYETSVVVMGTNLDLIDPKAASTEPPSHLIAGEHLGRLKGQGVKLKFAFAGNVPSRFQVRLRQGDGKEDLLSPLVSAAPPAPPSTPPPKATPTPAPASSATPVPAAVINVNIQPPVGTPTPAPAATPKPTPAH